MIFNKSISIGEQFQYDKNLANVIQHLAFGRLCQMNQNLITNPVKRLLKKTIYK